MLRTLVQLYVERNNPLRLRAHNCYRDLVKVEVHNFLHIRTTRTIIGRQRIGVSINECKQALLNKSIYTYPLTELSPGLHITSEIDDSNSSLPFWGTTLYLRSIYSIEEGEIASLDGIIVSSSLGSVSNCTLSLGACTIPGGTLIWEPTPDPPSCHFKLIGTYDALVTLRFLVISSHELTFQFSDDYNRQAKLLAHCSLAQAYLTTSSHVLVFPNIPSHITLQDYMIDNTSGYRRKRDTLYITDAQNRKSHYDRIPIQTPPLIHSLFAKSSLIELPRFNTRLIRDTLLLNEILRWNVSNEDFNRSKFYVKEDARISTLRTIRYLNIGSVS